MKRAAIHRSRSIRDTKSRSTTRARGRRYGHKTGAIYRVQPPDKIASKQPGEWNTFLIRVEGQIYNVTLNGEPVVINFKGNRSMRGHIGLQNHSPEDQVFFRDIFATPF